MRDASETLATEALPLLAAAGRCGVGLWSLDGNGVFRADSTLLSILGRTVDEFVRTESSAPACFAHPEDRSHVEAMLSLNPEPTVGSELVFRVIRPDGVERCVLCRRYPLSEREGSGEIGGIMLDLTAFRRSDDERARARRLESVAALAARLAHDFNNLLFAILGNATLALGTTQLPIEHPIRESLREIERAATRASEIVQRLSAFARPVQPRRQLLKLGTVVDTALGAVRDTLPPNVAVQTQVATREPALWVDPRLVQDVVTSLVSNAVHACEGRASSIDVAVEELTLSAQPWFPALAVQPGRYVELRVHDGGRGMDASTATHALEPFVSTWPKGVGMGLGLAIANGIVKGHHGALRIESEPGCGTTVHAYFPLA